MDKIINEESVTFEFSAHDYFITEQAIDDLYIFMRREMRRSPLPGMKQPIPNNAFMGMDTVLVCKFKGQPAIGYKWKLLKDDNIIQEGETDHNGMSFGLDVIYSNGICKCYPQLFRNTLSLAKICSDLNGRRCDVVLPIYKLNIIKMNLEHMSEGVSFDFPLV